jgi:hypothetical protein
MRPCHDFRNFNLERKPRLQPAGFEPYGASETLALQSWYLNYASRFVLAERLR